MEKNKFKVGDKIFVDHKELKGHECTITALTNSSVRVHHPTKNWLGYFTIFSLENIEITHVTKLGKALL